MRRARIKVMLACIMALLFGSAHVAADVIVVPWPVRPPNDNCDRAPIIGDVKDLEFDTTHATFDGPGHCTTSPNVWYHFVPPGTGEVTVSLARSLFDTKLAAESELSARSCTCSRTRSRAASGDPSLARYLTSGTR